MKRSIYTDATLLSAAKTSQDALVKVALKLGYDADRLRARMEWLAQQPEDYRMKVAKAVNKIGVTGVKSSQDDTWDGREATLEPLQTPQRSDIASDPEFGAGNDGGATPSDPTTRVLQGG